MSPFQHVSAPLPCRIVQGDDPGTFFNVASSGFDPANSEEQAQDASSCVVLLHGAGHCAQSWSAFVSRLNGVVKVIAPDLRGHGDSRASDEGDLRQGTLLRLYSHLFAALSAAGLWTAFMKRLVCVAASSASWRISSRFCGQCSGTLDRLWSLPLPVHLPTLWPRMASNPLTKSLPTSFFPQRDG